MRARIGCRRHLARGAAVVGGVVVHVRRVGLWRETTEVDLELAESSWACRRRKCQPLHRRELVS